MSQSLNQCPRCKRWLPKTGFYQDKSSPRGLTYWCKECVCEGQRRNRKNNLPLYNGTLKQCSECERWLPRTEFYRNRTRADGLAYRCKECAGTRKSDFEPVYDDELRQCTKCKRQLNKTEFYCSGTRGDGLSGWCKECDNEASHQRRSRIDNPPQYEGDSKWCPKCEQLKPRTEFHRNKRTPDGLCRWCKECAKSNARKYRRENKERIDETVQRWRKAHPKAIRIYYNRRRSRKQGAGGSYTVEQWEELCAQYDYRCLCCGEKKPLTVDHIVPISKGGSSDISNLQCLCHSCNASKSTKTIDYRSLPTILHCEHHAPGCAL